MIALEALTVTCPCCGFAVNKEAASPEGLTCALCHCRMEAAVFPALFTRDGNHAHSPVVADESACYFHADRVAEFACSRCGRFLCPMCRIAWPGEDLCVACLEAASEAQRTTKNNGTALASSRFHFDSLALALSTLPVLTWFLSLITAPVALGFAVFTFRKECSIAPRGKFRFVLAMLFSAATIAGWVALFIYIYRQNSMYAPPQG